MSSRQTRPSFTRVTLLAVVAFAIAACGGGSASKTGVAGKDGGHDSGPAGAAGMDAAAGAAGGTAGGGGADANDAPVAGADGAAGTGMTTDAAGAPAEAGDANGGDADAGTTDASDATGAKDAGDATDAHPGDAPTACDGEATCLAVAGSLSGLQWKLPCTAAPSGPACATVASTMQTTILGGANGTTYDVTLRFRGVVEQKTYTGGCAPGGGMWLSGGAESGDTFNVYRLSISSPPQTYFLNAGASSINHVFALDFQQTMRIDANARVTLYADAKDQQEIINVGTDGTTPVTVTGTTVAQPYNGQFIQMDVVSLQQDPVPSTSAVDTDTGRWALYFDGSNGQRLTIADAASLHPASVTVESWFAMSAPVGSYAVLASKGVGGGYGDSWVIWFESGSLHTGVDLSSTAASATVPWTPVDYEWHHAAEVFDAAAMQNLLYIDGTLVSCTPGTPPVTYDTHPMLVGADTDNGGISGFWTGSIDEVRVFSAARTGAQIWADMHTHKLGPTTGLVGEWTFDEGTGQTTADQSGSNNPGTLGAAGTAETTDPTWTNGGAPY
jgi:hypothetical protein